MKANDKQIFIYSQKIIFLRLSPQQFIYVLFFSFFIYCNKHFFHLTQCEKKTFCARFLRTFLQGETIYFFLINPNEQENPCKQMHQFYFIFSILSLRRSFLKITVKPPSSDRNIALGCPEVGVAPGPQCLRGARR